MPFKIQLAPLHIGLGESYMNGDFDGDLYEMLDMFCAGHPANTAGRCACASWNFELV